jgi:phage protein D
MQGVHLIWNGIPFGAIPGKNTFLPVQDFTLKTSVKIEADEETGVLKVTGRDPQQCHVNITASTLTGTDPRIAFETLNLLRGKSGGIYIGAGISSTLSRSALDLLQTSDWRKMLSLQGLLEIGKELLHGTKMGSTKFMLTSLAMNAGNVSATGNVNDAVLSLSFTEDSDQSQTGGLRVYVNDKDITSSISVASCYYDMHAEGEADSLLITFADTKKQWANWKPSAQGDTVRITDGAVDSGKLYIDALKPENGKYKLQAYSTPKSAYSKKSRSFENLNLQQIASKIAKENELTARFFDVPETRFKYVQQKGQSDLAFLQTLCKQRGVAFIIFNGALCLYSEKYLEGANAAKTLSPSRTDDFTITDDKQASWASCELRNGTYTGTASDANVKTGKTYRETVKAAWENQADANAAASARLRQLNKSGKRAELVMSTQRQLAAGSVVDLECNGWEGKAFIYRLRHDLLKKSSRLWLREPLSY